jgi:succinate dehydrogenase / fumarate reductase, cytochrome b subunit
MSKSNFTSLTKKFIMGMSGIFLILFLIVHCGLNALVFLGDGGATFEVAAHFMGTNIVMKVMEWGLVIGFLVHIIDGFTLWYQNWKARPLAYAKSNASSNSPWYSRSMGILGSLLLMFLVIHAGDFWIPNRLNQFNTGHELHLFSMMQAEFSNIFVVIIYVLACFSLFWHLLHGFKSAFQSLGLNHHKYNGFIEKFGIGFAIIVPTVFALMPLGFYFGFVK